MRKLAPGAAAYNPSRSPFRTGKEMKLQQCIIRSSFQPSRTHPCPPRSRGGQFIRCRFGLLLSDFPPGPSKRAHPPPLESPPRNNPGEVNPIHNDSAQMRSNWLRERSILRNSNCSRAGVLMTPTCAILGGIMHKQCDFKPGARTGHQPVARSKQSQFTISF